MTLEERIRRAQALTILGPALIAAVLAGLAIGFLFDPPHQDAMCACQIEHSYDTCFQALNR